MKLKILLISGLFGVSACGNGTIEERETPVTETAPCSACVSDFEQAVAGDRSVELDPPYCITLPGGKGDISLAGLLNHQGNTLDAAYIKKHFQGRKLALYFGFPDCDWFCPPSTKAIMEVLEKSKALDIVPVFIASRTDPRTGLPYTPQRMEEWLQTFGGDKIGAIALTGYSEDLTRIYNAMKVNDEHGNHVPYLALVDEHGEFVGSGAAVTLHRRADGKPYLSPAPQLLMAAIEKSFNTKEKTQPEQPVLERR